MGIVDTAGVEVGSYAVYPRNTLLIHRGHAPMMACNTAGVVLLALKKLKFFYQCISVLGVFSLSFMDSKRQLATGQLF